jgi:triacylglycerol lipase
MRRIAMLAAALTLIVAGPASAAPLPVSYHFLQDAITYGAQASPPGANQWNCRPSAAHPTPVVLVHGTAGSAAGNWASLSASLKNNGYCVYALTYGVAPEMSGLPVSFGGMNRIQDSAKELASFVTKVRRATGAARVDLVGHSQGTLMPDYYAKFLGGAHRIHSYISLAPLWHGTGLGDVRPLLALAFGDAVTDPPVPFCAACGEMSTSSDFMATMRAGGVAVPGIHYTNIVTRYDELVRPYTSGIEPGMTNIVLQDRCPLDFTEHFEIAADKNATVLVLNALDPAHPRPLSCVPVLPFVGGP